LNQATLSTQRNLSPQTLGR